MKLKNFIPVIVAMLFVILLILSIRIDKEHFKQEKQTKDTTVVHEIVIDYTTYEQCIQHLKEYEGFRSKPYELDGGWYIGYGQQTKSFADTVSDVQADSMLRNTFDWYVELMPKMYNVYGDKALALALLWYNVSPTSIKGGTLHRLILEGSGDNMAIRDSWMSLCNFQGKPHKKLQERRQFEVSLFFN